MDQDAGLSATRRATTTAPRRPADDCAALGLLDPRGGRMKARWTRRTPAAGAISAEAAQQERAHQRAVRVWRKRDAGADAAAAAHRQRIAQALEDRVPRRGRV